MTTIIINPDLPLWAKRGDPRPPLWMKRYFPKIFEKELMIYGSPGEVGKYFSEEIMERVRESSKI